MHTSRRDLWLCEFVQSLAGRRLLFRTSHFCGFQNAGLQWATFFSPFWVILKKLFPERFLVPRYDLILVEVLTGVFSSH